MNQFGVASRSVWRCQHTTRRRLLRKLRSRAHTRTELAGIFSVGQIAPALTIERAQHGQIPDVPKRRWQSWWHMSKKPDPATVETRPAWSIRFRSACSGVRVRADAVRPFSVSGKQGKSAGRMVPPPSRQSTPRLTTIPGVISAAARANHALPNV